MRLIIPLLIVTSLAGGFTGTAQTISISVKNTPIVEVFSLIERQAGVKFFYRVEFVNKAHNVSLQLSQVTLKNALDACFKNQPLTYELIDKIVVVKEKPSANPPRNALQAQVTPASSRVVHGRVVTAGGEPVEMASIIIKGKKKAAYSNANGEFIIHVDDEKDILTVTAITIEPAEVKVANETNLTILVKKKSAILEPVQLIGYGQTTKRFNTGNVTTIRSDEIGRQPVNNILAALKGLVPGLAVTQRTGVSGGAFDVVMRGNSTLRARGDPLVIIDGVPFPLDVYRTPLSYKFNNGSAKAGGSPLNMLNIGDIEQVDVLKDADATAIYGSRGGNGVILITTKKGRPGKTTLDFNTYSGLGSVTRLPKMLNLQQYLEMRREAKKNDNAQITSGDFDINGTWDTTHYTNWSKELLGGTASITNAQLSLSGGSNRTSYQLNGTYHRETSVIPGPGADRNYALYFNAAQHSKNRKLKTALSMAFLSKTDDLLPVDFTSTLRLYIPNQPDSFVPEPSSIFVPAVANPYMELKRLYKMNARNLVSSLKISYELVRGLELSAMLGINRQHQHDFSGIPKAAQLPGNTSNAKYSSNRLNTLIIEPQALYSISVNDKTKLSVLVGSTYQNSVSTYEESTATDFSNDALLDRPEYAASANFVGRIYKDYRYLGSFSRLSYNNANKYLVNLTGRIDGTSRIGPGKQFHPFGAVGAAWIFSEEKFLKRLRWVNLAKFRGSYGVIGNSEIPDYSFSSLYDPVNGPYQGIRGLDPDNLYNPDLGWELKKSAEVAMELQLFKNRLELSVSLYRSLNSEQLLVRGLSAVTGFDRVVENGQSIVENKGLETTVRYTPFRGPNLSWSLMATATLPKDKLREFEGIENTAYNEALSVEQPLTRLKLYRFGGVDPLTGTVFFLDKNGKPAAILTNDDKTGFVDTDPKFYGSVTSSLKYKGFSFDVDWMFMVRRGRVAFDEKLSGGYMQNQPVEILSRWQKPGDVTSVAKYSQNYLGRFLAGNPSIYDQQYTSASYVRLQNVSLSYSFTKGLLKEKHLENLRFYLLGQNLLTFTPYKNLDPETISPSLSDINPRLPLLRTLTAGFQITFN